MKIKNFKAFTLALGILFCSSGNAEINSYSMQTTLKNGQKAMLYFTTGDGKDDYSYVSFDNMVGFIPNSNVNYEYLDTNNEFKEIVKDLTVQTNNAYIYQTPEVSNSIMGVAASDSIIHVVAKNKQGWYAVASSNNQYGFIHETAFQEKKDEVLMAKITGNNINVRSSASINKNNIIGFADITDRFEILGKENDWYIINYLGNVGYVHRNYVQEINIDKADTQIIKMVYLSRDTPLYSAENGSMLTVLPQYQYLSVISEKDGYYRVTVDGVVGLVDKIYTKKLTNTFAIGDTGRQIIKVFKNNQEVYRRHYISGRKDMPSDLGCFKVGHMLEDYQLTPEHKVKRWIQFNGNEGFHDAQWQKDKYYDEVAKKAYELFMQGRAKTYPYAHGSHGCSNMKLEDVIILYGLLHVGDNVLVIGPNNLVNDHLLSDTNHDYLIYIDNPYAKIKKLV